MSHPCLALCACLRQEVCKRFRFHVPGGVDENGKTIWGWNDIRGAYCAGCGQRDIDHIVLRMPDYKEEPSKKRAMRAAVPASALPEDAVQKEAALARVAAMRNEEVSTSAEAALGSRGRTWWRR